MAQEFGTDFSGIIWWPYLDFNQLGRDKEMEAFDVIATAPEGLSVSIGWDQRDLNARTDPYTIEADTVPGAGSIPMPMTAPSFDMKLEFEPNQAWEWFAANIHINR